MKRVTDFAGYLTDFLGRYLPLEYGASVNTIATYSQTFILFLRYMQKVELIRAESVCLKDITRDSIVGFLKWIEKERSVVHPLAMPGLGLYTHFLNTFNTVTSKV